MQELASSRRLPHVVRTVAAAQQLVITRAQLADLGISDEGVASRAAQGIWVEIGPRVVVLQSGSLTKQQRWWAGVLHASPGAALSHASAAEAGGLQGFEHEEVDVTVAHGREVTGVVHPLLTIRVHQTRHPTGDLVPLRVPARHSVARSVIEMASLAAHDNRCRALVAASVQQQLVRPEHLRAFLAGRRTLPRRRLIAETIDDVAGGAHSLPETDYARALRRAGLPEPTRQLRVRRPNGTWYLDNDFTPWAVTVEVNGAQHFTLLARESDDSRRSTLQIRGRLVVDVSSHVVRHRARLAVLRTADALMARGYAPPARTARLLRSYAAAESYPWASSLDLPP